MATLVTLGFAGKSLETFVEALKSNGVQRLVDIRLRQNSQLSAFALGRDLAYLLPTYLDIEYVHEPLLAPTPEILDAYRVDKDWAMWKRRFTALLVERDMPAVLARHAKGVEVIAFLCSEAKATECHRGVLADAYVAKHPRTKVLHA